MTYDVTKGLTRAGVDKVYLEVSARLTDPCGPQPIRFPEIQPEPKKFNDYLPKDI